MLTFQYFNNFKCSKRPQKNKKKGQQYGQNYANQKNFILIIRINAALLDKLNQKKKNNNKNQDYLKMSRIFDEVKCYNFWKIKHYSKKYFKLKN